MYLTGDILQASDDLSHVINSYKKIVEGQTINGETQEAQKAHTSARQGARTLHFHILHLLWHIQNNI